MVLHYNEVMPRILLRIGIDATARKMSVNTLCRE
jgi:hypothetical protein